MEDSIDVFFLKLLHFSKETEDNVSALKRNVETGYALTPGQLRETLQVQEHRCRDIDQRLNSIERRITDTTPLIEIAGQCSLMYQHITSGVQVLEAHLRNYGYQDDRERKTPFDPITFTRQTTKNTPTASLPVQTHRLSLTMTKQSVGQSSFHPQTLEKDPTNRESTADGSVSIEKVIGERESLGYVSSLSRSLFHCSPGTLALKKKYDEIPSTPTFSIHFSDDDLMETEESIDLEPRQDQKEDVDPERLLDQRFSIPLPQSPRNTTHSHFCFSPFPKPARFGSPYRSPHRPESSIPQSPVEERESEILQENYENLPSHMNEKHC